ncbi:hypothetical protein N7522_004731 [Penicillium canescens]|nr:hypothetical protein N7522_004731 [Penicillium canescens]
MSDREAFRPRLKRLVKWNLSKAKESNDNIRSTSTASWTQQSNPRFFDKTSASTDKSPQTGAEKLKAQGTSVPTPAQIQATDTTVTEPGPSSLWDKAYDSLKLEQPDAWSTYENLLSLVLIEALENSTSESEHEADTSDVKNQIPQHDVAARREKLEQIAELGLKHIEDGRLRMTIFGKKMGLRDAVGKFAKGVDWIQAYARDALKDVPYAPVAMAGISILLVFLRNPAAVDTDNQEGLRYVSSQIRYYVAMEPLFLSPSMMVSLKDELIKSLIDLYKLVVDFQVQSVLRFYSSSGKRYVKDVTKYDSWDVQLDLFKEREDTLHKNLKKALNGASLQQLEKLKKEARESRKTLEIISNHAQAVEQHMSDAEYRRCLGNLKATNPIDDKERIETDKGRLFEDSYRWVLENDHFQSWRNSCGHLLWITGEPGKGKTMLLCGIINELPTHDTNVAFFFCQENRETLNNATAVLRGLISMLVKQQPVLQSHVGEGPFEGENAWFALRKVLINVLKDPMLRLTYLIIDALDECTKDLEKLLSFLVEISSDHTHIKWLVSSRNWPSIEKDLRDVKQTRLILENETLLSTAVDSFIQHKINVLAKRHDYTAEIRDKAQDYLVSNANGTFLWVALVCKELANVPKRHVLKKLDNLPPGLNDLYTRMLDQITESDDAEICKSLLSVTTTVYRPLTLDEIPSYIQMSEDDANDLKDIIGHCGSFLYLREHTISLVHQSAKDFFLQRKSDMVYPGGIENVHYDLFSRSLRAMEMALRRDIYSINDPGYPIRQVKRPNPDPLAAARPEAEKGWSTCLQTLEGHTRDVRSVAWSQDGSRIASASWDRTVRIWDPVTGHCTLKLEGINGHFSSIAWSQGRLALGAADNTVRIWDTVTGQCKLSLHGHGGHVTSIAWLQDGRLVSASLDTTLRIWDTTTGQCVHVFDGHTGPVISIALSQGQLASGSTDGRVKVWELNDYHCVSTLEGYNKQAGSIAWSPDGSRLASASMDNTVSIWALTSQCNLILKGHTDAVGPFAWSEDGSRLASASWDKTIRVWDTTTGQNVFTFKGHTEVVYSIAWSHGRNRLASGSLDDTVRIWDTVNGQGVSTFEGHTGTVYSVAWSQDGSRLSSGSLDRTVRIWDTVTDYYTPMVERGHKIGSIAWSQDGSRLASASRDKTVKIWNPDTGQCITTLEVDSGLAISVAWSRDGSRLASACFDDIVNIWDLATGRCISMLQDASYGLLESFGFKLDRLFGDIMPTAFAEPSVDCLISLPQKHG